VNRFFNALGCYLDKERPAIAATDRVFVVLKGPRRGLPLSAEGLDEVLGRCPPPGWAEARHLP
jgi:integrase/recombinase XerD